MKDVEILLEKNGEEGDVPLPVKVMKVEDYTQNITRQFELFVDKGEEENNSIETLWEI